MHIYKKRDNITQSLVRSQEILLKVLTSPPLRHGKSRTHTIDVIIDLSWPKGELVNAGVDKNAEFSLTFPTVDTITNQLVAIGKGAHIYKVNISRAFRRLKIDPLDYDLLALKWNDVYVDMCLPFGSRHTSQIFQNFSWCIT